MLTSSCQQTAVKLPQISALPSATISTTKLPHPLQGSSQSWLNKRGQVFSDKAVQGLDSGSLRKSVTRQVHTSCCIYMMTTECATNRHLQVFPELASRWLFRPNLTARDLELPVVIHPRTKVATQRVISHQRTRDEKGKLEEDHGKDKDKEKDHDSLCSHLFCQKWCDVQQSRPDC